MSFTTGTLFHHESSKLISLYLEFEDWATVREKVISDNLLQTRTMNSSKRFCSEIISRLKTLSHNEIKLYTQLSTQQQGYLLWLAVCRRYRFIAEFAVEVLRENYISLKNDLSYEDFDCFFNKKSEWHTKLDQIRPTTKQKLRQILFKMLREAELLTSQNIIIAARLTPELISTIVIENRQNIIYFPAFDCDLRDFL